MKQWGSEVSRCSSEPCSEEYLKFLVRLSTASEGLAVRPLPHATKGNAALVPATAATPKSRNPTSANMSIKRSFVLHIFKGTRDPEN